MSTEFAFNLFQFGDAAGSGEFLVGHFRQHLRYNAVLAARSPAVVIPEFPILNMEAGPIGRRYWLDSHEKWNEKIRPYANVTGINLSEVDLDNETAFYDWLNIHSLEHQELDQAFGVA